jgi:hypothetical protein
VACACSATFNARRNVALTSATNGDSVMSGERLETACPACAELILVDARKCKFCGEWIQRAEPAPPKSILDQQQNYGVPYRLEQQTQHTNQGGRQISTSSVGFAIQGDVCPQCRVASFTNEYSLWHWLLAILFFPLGLLVLLFPIKTCTQCNSPYGAGKKMAEVVRLIAMVYLAFLALIVFGLCAVVTTASAAS